jgi:glycosyltransferase involved in cell wall biosynthesis
MAEYPDSDNYQKGVRLAEAGRHEEALRCMQEHLRRVPHDAKALNDSGAILHCLTRPDEAIACLSKARSLEPQSGEIIWNLMEVYLGGGYLDEAIVLLDEMERMGLLNVDVLNRLATMLVNQARRSQALDVLLRSRRLWPEQDILAPIMEVIRRQRPNVAFFREPMAGDGALADTCAYVRDRFVCEFHHSGDTEEVIKALGRCDIAWFDGGGPASVAASQQLSHVKRIVSLRRSDVEGRWASAMRWENIDILAAIGGSAVEEALERQVPDIRSRTRIVVVPNGVDLERYAFQQRHRGNRLACIGCLSMETNPGFLLQCMQKLHYVDPSYRLTFSGQFESPVLEQYVRHMTQTLHLEHVVTFEPYPNNLNAWLSDKHFIVSSGIGESQVEMVLAGMACGLKPVVHSFPGAERLFSPEHLFSIAEEFCERVLSSPYEPEAYRRWVEARYPLAEQFAKVRGILDQLEREIDRQRQCVGAVGQAARFDPASYHSGLSPVAPAVPMTRPRS